MTRLRLTGPAKRAPGAQPILVSAVSHPTEVRGALSSPSRGCATAGPSWSGDLELERNGELAHPRLSPTVDRVGALETQLEREQREGEPPASTFGTPPTTPS